jgi:hypothetical protein
VAARRTTADRSIPIRTAGAIGLTIVGMALAPIAPALADDGPASPATPIVRDAGTGIVLAGPSEVRVVDKKQVLGGGPSAGANIVVADGNPHQPTDGRQPIAVQHRMASFCNRAESGITVFCRDRGR